MALVDWSSAEQCEWWDGATNTSSIPLVRPGSNIMLRLLTLTFSQPGYRLLMLTETAGQRGAVRAARGSVRTCPPSQPLPMCCPAPGRSVPTPLLLQVGLCVCPSCCFVQQLSQKCCVGSFCLLHLPGPFPVPSVPGGADLLAICHWSVGGPGEAGGKGRGISSFLTACCFSDTSVFL